MIAADTATAGLRQPPETLLVTMIMPYRVIATVIPPRGSFLIGVWYLTAMMTLTKKAVPIISTKNTWKL